VKAVLGADTVLAATRRADLIGIRLLQDDIDGFAEVAVVVPMFFLTVVVLVLATIMSRQVDRERPVVGTLLALGVSRSSVLGHYVGYGLITGLLATGLGCGAGILLGYQFAAAYVRELLIPFVTLRVNGWVLVAAVALGLAAALLACLLPAWRAAGVRPAEAIRPFQATRAPRHPAGRGDRHRRSPLLLRLALRNLGRQPLRTLGAIAGVAAALILLVGTRGMLDSTSRLLALALEEGPRYDLRADFSLPRPGSELESAVQRIDGVQAVETILCLPVQVRRPGSDQSETTVAEILPLESPLLKVLAPSGRTLSAGPQEVLLSDSLARQIGVGVGDEVELVFDQAGKPVRRTVGALSGTFMTEPVALFGPETAEELGLPGLASTVLVRTAPDRADAVRAALAELPGATRLTAMPQFRRQLRELMSLAYLLIGVLFGSGAVLAGCILFNTVTMGVAERRRELATMRADGHSMGSIAGLVTLENLATGLAGTAVGLPLGLVILRQLVATFNSELFSMPFVISPPTLLLAAGTILAVAVAAQGPALMMIARTDLAEATRARE
jgi:putative ABC transport system permease protein